MKKVFLLASGATYQAAAGRSAATYAIHRHADTDVTVCLPEGETISSGLERDASRFGFRVTSFPWERLPGGYLTYDLKCRFWLSTVNSLSSDDEAMWVDADTVCVRPWVVPQAARKAIATGVLGAVQDICCRYSQDPQVAWHLEDSERLRYVNAGVLMGSGKTGAIFEKVYELACQERFRCADLGDQTVLNFVLARYFPDRLHLLPRELNQIRNRRNPEACILHFAGGAGELGEPNGREEGHRQACERILRTVEPLEESSLPGGAYHA